MPADKQFGMERRPLPDDLDPTDPDATRAAMLEGVRVQVTHTGRLSDGMCVFLPSKQLVAQTEGVYDIGEDEIAAATFRGLAAWEDALRAYRTGEQIIDGRRIATVLELDADPVDGEERWWVATRTVGTREGDVGVLHGEWDIRSGVGVEAMPEILQEWLHAGNHVVRMDEPAFAPQDKPPVDLRMAQGVFPEAVPERADQLAEAIGQGFDQEVLTQGLDCIVVMAMRQTEYDRWELRGELPCPLDELVRVVVQWSEASSVAVVAGKIAELHGAPRKAVSTIAEVGGRRYERALPLTFGPGGQAQAMEAQGRWHHPPDGDLAQEQRWVGQPPSDDVELYLPMPGATPAEG